MRKFFKWLGDYWNKIEYPFSIVVVFVMMALNVLFLQLTILDKMNFVWLLFYAAMMSISTIWFLRCSLAIRKSTALEGLNDNYREVYNDLQKSYRELHTQFESAVETCKDWKKYANEYKDYAEKIQETYIGNVKTVLAVTTEHSEVMPQQQAILSNLVDNVVQASTIKSMVEFSKHLTNDDTVFLIRVDHKQARWYFKVTGRSINLNQALSIVDGAKKKLNDFADKNSLVKKVNKIPN